MQKTINEATSHLTQYLYDELVCIICSYLWFNTQSLIFEKSFVIPTQKRYKINTYNNKIYLYTFGNGQVIIYDMKTNETFHLITNLKNIYSIRNIDDDNIIIGTFLGIYIYSYNIINGKINVISIKRKFENCKITDIYYFENKIIFSTISNIHIYSLADDLNNICKFNLFSESIFLYNEHLYIFNFEKYLIKILNINNKSERIVSFSLENLNNDIILMPHIFVNETYIYILVQKYVYVFDHDVKIFRRIHFNIPNLNQVFNVDSDKIYLGQNFENSINLKIFQQKFRYKNIIL